MGKYVGFATQSGAQIHKVNREKNEKGNEMKSFWLFAIVLSMSSDTGAQAGTQRDPDHFNTGVDTDTES